MLSLVAKAHFDSLLSIEATRAWRQLASRQDEFERAEFSRGQSPNGGGFAARLSELYKDCLSTQAKTISDTLLAVHRDFECPLDEDVDAQLADWGARAIADFYQNLELAYARHLQSFGIELARASGLDQTYALATTTIANLTSHHLWEFRNVPTKRPYRLPAAAPVQLTINNSGTIGAVQTGEGSTAKVEQQWVSGDLSELRVALAALLQALKRTNDVQPDLRIELIADVESAMTELQQERPSARKLLRWLGGIGASVGAIGNLQPAYETLKAVARALGIPL